MAAESSDKSGIEDVTGFVSEKLVINEPPKIEETPNRKLIRTWLNRSMKVKVTDGRTVIGIFLCTDKHSNLILGSCHEYFDTPGKRGTLSYKSK